MQIRGHAIECRINAEDPKTFMPSPGPIRLWHPPGGPGVRVDSHVYSGYNVPPNYDSLIGKVIAHGETREAAIARMKNALAEMVIEGIKTNIALHQEICSHPAFRAGGQDIHYLERRLGSALGACRLPGTSFDLGAGWPRSRRGGLLRGGALSVTLEDSSDDAVLEPAPGEMRLWPPRACRRCSPRETDAGAWCSAWPRALGIAAGAHPGARVADRVWEREWLKDFHAMRFGARLWVCPRHEQVSDTGRGRGAPGSGPGLRHRHARDHRDVPDLARCATCAPAPGSSISAVARGCWRRGPEARRSAVRCLRHRSAGAAGHAPTMPQPMALPRASDVHAQHATPAGRRGRAAGEHPLRPLCELAPRFAALTARAASVILAGHHASSRSRR